MIITRNIFFFICLILSNSVFAKDNPLSQSPIFIDADLFEYVGETNNEKIIYKGNVEATQDNQKLVADLVEYNHTKDTITAEGNISLIEKNGYIIKGDKITLYDKMKYGSIGRFDMLLPDKSTLKGASAKKDDERWTNINKGFYTSCKVCENKSPIWNITANTTTLDEEKNKMTYKHAIFKFYGTPILYTPYFSHYTSKAKRQSGFLYPIYGGSSYLGKAVKVPFYLNLALNYDATIRPVFTSSRGQALEGEYRHLFPEGTIYNIGSITSAKYYDIPSDQAPLKHNIRYNFESKTNLIINESRDFGWQIKTTSDKSYRRDYGYGSEDFLTSRIYNNSYQKNGFFEVQTMAFQNLRPKTTEDENQMHQTPLVMPLFKSKHQIYEFQDNSKWNFSSNILKIHRYSGADSNRLSIKNQWQKPLLLNNGNNFNFFSSVRNDVYYYDSAPINNKTYTGYTSRTIPEAGVDWSFPLGKKIGESQVAITPLATAIATPYSNYNKDIYNEDSGESNEINDTNLFAPSQFNGIDLIENTPRIGYGVKNSIYYKDNLNASALLGQMYQQKPQASFSDSGNNHFSDFIGRLKFDFSNKFIVSDIC